MAKFTPYGIYTYVRQKILDVYPDMYITWGEEPIPPEGLAVEIHEVDHYRMLRGLTLEDLGDAWHVTFEANVYSNSFNDGADEAYSVMDVIEKAFEKMFFIEYECLPLKRANNRVFRLVARFERNLGYGDDMPEE